jgi:hypothetical protein
MLFFFTTPLGAVVEKSVPESGSDIYKCIAVSGHVTYTYRLCAPSARMEVVRVISVDVDHSVALARLQEVERQLQAEADKRTAERQAIARLRLQAKPAAAEQEQLASMQMQCQQAKLKEDEFSRQLRSGCSRRECERLRSRRAHYQIRVDRFC